MPDARETAARKVAARAASREASRRAEAVTTLAIAEATVSYARRQVSNGLSPLEARQALIETAAELGAVAASLQRLARLRPAERRAMVTMLTNMGMRGPEIAARLGLSQRSVYRYRAASRAR